MALKRNPGDEVETLQKQENQILSIEDDDENLDRFLNSIDLPRGSVKLSGSTSSRSLKSILKKGGVGEIDESIDLTRNGSNIKSQRSLGSMKEIHTNPSDVSLSSLDISISSSKIMRRTISQVSFTNVEIREYDR